MAGNKGLPRDPRVNYHFRTRHFEFFFQWLVGTAVHGGAETGESFYVASQIKDGDPESWVRAWSGMAERVEKRAQESFSRGHRISSREAYLRAYGFHRASTAFMNPFTDEPRMRTSLARARRCFDFAVTLFDGMIDKVRIPYEGTYLPGYFLKAEWGAEKHPTLIMIGGGDTFVEDLYFYIGPAAIKRGYHVLMVDLPGQGDLPFSGMHFPVEAELPMRAIVDYALARPETDPERLVAYGLSGGGYLVPRAACYEKRLKAIAVCSVILNMRDLFSDKLATFDRSLTYKLLRAVGSKKLDSFWRVVMTYAWRWGAKSPAELLEIIRGHRTDPGLITCPMLNLVAEQEYEHLGPAKEWAEACLKQSPHNRLVIAPKNEGADSHGAGSNLALMSSVVFDWFDELFDGQS